ncbi:MAG TPA: dihydropteroate synthase [Candidatus Eisenbacteria bacterium]|uniref:dihydropteroate synthase n=1 Tax=Eiseniibacteriota bacterium TaxID=2212470 RepID=A0A7V2AV86_UNCEI|nr:dihydropteroate synthase [Candidatus Eisenbacteria bacterium]
MRYSLRLISTRSRRTIEEHLERAGVDPEGVTIMADKAECLVIRVDGVTAAAANIIKQQLLSIGGDAAVHRDVITGHPPSSTVYIFTDKRRIPVLSERLSYQPFGLAELSGRIPELVAAAERPPQSIPLPGGRSLDLSPGPVVMGIINATPDSFSDGGEFLEPSRAVDRAIEMVEEGAGIIDIGGESSRPGSRRPGAEEELSRVAPILEGLSGAIDVPISIDTRSARVAEAAVGLGACIINDISGLSHDPAMPETAVRSGAAVVVMHMQGTPETMQDDPRYDDAVTEIIGWLAGRTEELISAGVPKDKIIIDPGIGFGKRLIDNLAIFREMGDFRGLGFPLLVGYSRKSFIGMLTERKPGERLWGGLAALGMCLEGGAQILRVHDVGETIDYIKVWKAVATKGSGS